VGTGRMRHDQIADHSRADSAPNHRPLGCQVSEGRRLLSRSARCIEDRALEGRDRPCSELAEPGNGSDYRPASWPRERGDWREQRIRSTARKRTPWCPSARAPGCARRRFHYLFPRFAPVGRRESRGFAGARERVDRRPDLSLAGMHRDRLTGNEGSTMKLRGCWLLSLVLALCACATPSPVPTEAVRAELTSTGKLRFGVVAGPERTEFFVVKNAGGQPEGVPVELARELGRRLGVPVEFKVAPSPLELTEMLLGGKIDSAIMPPDRWGRQRVDFGTLYFVDRESYLVPRGSRLKTIDEVDSRRVRVIAIEGTATDRAAARRLRNTTVNPVDSLEGAL